MEWNDSRQMRLGWSAGGDGGGGGGGNKWKDLGFNLLRACALTGADEAQPGRHPAAAFAVRHSQQQPGRARHRAVTWWIELCGAPVVAPVATV